MEAWEKSIYLAVLSNSWVSCLFLLHSYTHLGAIAGAKAK